MKTIFSLLLLIITSLVFGQNFSYKYLSQIDSFILHDTLPFRFQLAATDYSFIGEYDLTLKTYDKQFGNQRMPKPVEQQKNIVAKLKPTDAIDYILQEANKTKIVIFNETHWQPLHRAFVTSLLSKLQSIGYNFIGIEALDYSDTLLSKRKYPIISSGYYTREPSFGNLIRTAIKLNYTLFPYESYVQLPSEREIKQAENIKAIIDKNPSAKFIIYCGLDHCIEDSSHNSMIIPMAGRLKQMTGIDPFTIDQVELTERSSSNFENTYRQLLKAKYNAVFVDENQKVFNKAFSRKIFDCNVYHPKTKYIKGRPGWLLTPDKKLLNITNKITIDFPCMVKVYENSDDFNIAVPIDIIELKNKTDSKNIVVSKTKKYSAIITNIYGQRQTINTK